VAAILLEAFPQSVGIPNKALDLPLHTAIMHFKSPDHIRYLISRSQKYNKGSILEENLKGDSPFSLLCAQIDTGVDIACISFPLFRADLRLWQNLNTLLEAINAIDDSNDHQYTATAACRRKYQALHSFISLSCPPSAICLAHMINPEQVHEVDGKGRYPLSLAAEQKSCPGFILKRLMCSFPQAVLISDDHGRLPLHWAAMSGRKWEDGLMLFFNRMPSAVSLPDSDGMYPFMLSAAAKCPSVESIYRLLRECPSIF
jgi:ankyrin repeat protein